MGRLAGDSALLMVAWVLCLVPGFVTSFFGLLMIFPPTRALMRRSIGAQAQRSMEEFGVRMYEASPMSTLRTSYGSFTPEAQPGRVGRAGTTHRESAEEHEVIDADELERWYRMDGPGEHPEGRQQ
ncbi:FxsA family protein [Corynebacterium aquatimens]|uniref:FxsA family protein n=1 Tax=Corynebacterium aquatimens TaxID=1190508 RepID=UPI002546487F|nr:FxsA family protein [Corynebacterium aquatimens]